MAIEGLTARGAKDAVPITAVAEDKFEAWLTRQPRRIAAWTRSGGFRAKPGQLSLLAADDGALAHVFLGLPKPVSGSQGGPDGTLWAFAACPRGLPEGSYALSGRVGQGLANDAALGWALGAYQFARYRKPERAPARLIWPKTADRKAVENAAEATILVRDLVNTPAGDMGPSALAAEARRLGRAFGARVSVTVGDRLLDRNFPAIHAVGRAAADAPRLIDINWRGRERGKLPLIAICGKGVCFDTGGLDMKSTAGIKLMKKDMGGAAQALGLARMIMGANLPVRLRVLIPAVENAVSGNAYHPLDVVNTRKGITVEVGNTDAEGRIVLSDAMAEASRQTPDLLIDMATLTGAARVALGTGLPAMFCNDDGWADKTLAAGHRAGDPLWRLPLWAPYRRDLNSKVADINNISAGSYGGAITAALFLQEFVGTGIPWIHLDFMAWNTSSRPGRPEGGEAQGMRALFALIESAFAG
ncbi:MAG TPA: leucyl aminopeptidase family protein [Alphaproteobacteria bacterium]|nr:leucyl aminopeptidase family protein [Alphaproteobacteria bacterium]